jgi:hypothetical protein
VVLGEATEIVGINIDNAPGVNFSIGNIPSTNKVAQPVGCKWLELVVVRAYDGFNHSGFSLKNNEKALTDDTREGQGFGVQQRPAAHRQQASIGRLR